MSGECDLCGEHCLECVCAEGGLSIGELLSHGTVGLCSLDGFHDVIVTMPTYEAATGLLNALDALVGDFSAAQVRREATLAKVAAIDEELGLYDDAQVDRSPEGQDPAEGLGRNDESAVTK